MSYMHYYNVWYFKYTPNIQHTRLSIKYEYLLAVFWSTLHKKFLVLCTLGYQ